MIAAGRFKIPGLCDPDFFQNVIGKARAFPRERKRIRSDRIGVQTMTQGASGFRLWISGC